MIYVDEPKYYDKKLTGLRWDRWSHLWSSTNDVAELHTFAAKLGLKRSWFQDRRGHRYNVPHYDVVPSVRTRALRLGAQPMELRVWIEARRRLNEQ